MAEKELTYGSKVRKAVKRIDAWTNVITGLGTTRDKSTSNEFSKGIKLDDATADDLYADDDMAALICDTIPYHSLREGFSVRIPLKDEEMAEDMDDAAILLKKQAIAISESILDLGVIPKTVDAQVWGNVFGAGVLILGINDGKELSEPLDEDNIESFDHINVADKRYMTPKKWYTDPNEPKLGEPETYELSPQEIGQSSDASLIEIHETRLVIFGGVRTSVKKRRDNNGWEHSLLHRVNHTLTQFGISWDTLSHLIQDANQGVYKMAGLIDAIASDNESVVVKRMTMIDTARSVVRALVLDAETESFERPAFNWSGIEKPFELLMMRLSASSRIPVTILMGRSPAGENATGDSDFRALYDNVSSNRILDLEPALRRIVNVLLKAKKGPTKGQVPEGWSIYFPPLWQPTPKEQAEIHKTQSEADKNYVEAAVLTREEVALSRFPTDGWNMETNINLASRLLPTALPVPPTLPSPEPTPELITDEE